VNKSPVGIPLLLLEPDKLELDVEEDDDEETDELDEEEQVTPVYCRNSIVRS